MAIKFSITYSKEEEDDAGASLKRLRYMTYNYIILDDNPILVSNWILTLAFLVFVSTCVEVFVRLSRPVVLSNKYIM